MLKSTSSLIVMFMLILFAMELNAEPIWQNANVWYPTGVTMDSAGTLFTTAGLGLYKSTNNGTSWVAIDTSQGMESGFAIIVNPVSNDVIVAVEPGVYRSSDGGANWTKLTNSIVGAYALGTRADGLLIAAGSPGIWRSTNNGDSWTKTSTSLGPLHNGVAFSKTGVVFVVSLTNGLLRSTNDGISWEGVSAAFGGASNVQDVVADTIGGYVYATAFHQFFMDPTYNKVFRSSDDGASWVQVDSVVGISLSMGVNADGHVFTGRGPTAYSTDHGETWIEVSSGIQQGDRLVEINAGRNGRMFIADMDDSMKYADFAVPGYVCGDADGNQIVTISDAVFLISYIFAGGPVPDPVAAGDADCNSLITISDAVLLINYIFAGGAAPCSTCR